MQDEARHERSIRRIIALLVAFAGLAGRAPERSQPVRFLLLLVLRHTEDVAREYVAGVLGVDGLWFDDGMECTSRPEDAALLAERFRLLAEQLVGCLQPGLRFGAPLPRRGGAPSGAPRRVAGRPAAMAFAQQPAHDTS